ncbi:DUF4236 domain-containing protein [Polaromonas sp. UC242_47]|uniref:DUF4236 domain-containing protein n=1 Tax=Polaromonas sp. UC242_47 TaxID=3374626 RepID=UPI003788B1FA
MRFRKSIKLAPGIRMNLSGSGASWTLGPRGASIGIGKRGTFLNAGVPGSGFSFRQSLSAGSTNAVARPQIASPQKVSLTVEVADDGVITFKDASGNSVSEELIDAAKKQKGDAIRILIQQACDKINDQVDAVSKLHLFTPDPRTPPHFQPQSFPDPKPQPPNPRQLGFFAKLFKSNVARVEAEYRKAMDAYEAGERAWNKARGDFESLEDERRQSFFKVQRGDQHAVETFLGEVLLDISWPRETLISYEVGEDGRTLRFDVDLPEVQDMPQKTATVPQRGYKLSVKELGPVQLQKLYAQHIHSIGFRLLGEAFAMIPTVQEVLLSGYSQRVSPATGQVQDDYLFSVNVSRSAWERIDFARLGDIDVAEALGQFNLVRSMTKSGLFKPIRPLTE